MKRILLWLMLSGLAFGQSSTFCSSGSNCAYTGNNTHSGSETFSGSTTVPTPTLPSQAATKAYVDSSAGAGALPLTGGTLTGPLNGTSANFSGSFAACTVNDMYVAGSLCYPTITAAETAAKAAGKCIYIPAGYAGADSLNPSSGYQCGTDNRNGTFAFYHYMTPIHPITGFPMGGDAVYSSIGPADTYVGPNIPGVGNLASTTSSTAVTGGVNVTVTTPDRCAGNNGNEPFSALAGIFISDATGVEAVGTITTPSCTTMNFTPTFSHASGFGIYQDSPLHLRNKITFSIPPVPGPALSHSLPVVFTDGDSHQDPWMEWPGYTGDAFPFNTVRIDTTASGMPALFTGMRYNSTVFPYEQLADLHVTRNAGSSNCTYQDTSTGGAAVTVCDTGVTMSVPLVADSIAAVTMVPGNISGTYYAKVGDALQTLVNAIDTAGGGTLILPPGTFTGDITLPDDGICVNIVGQGISATTIVGAISKGNSSTPYGCKIADLSVDGALAQNPVVQLKKGKGWQLQNLKITGAANGGEQFQIGQTGTGSDFYEGHIDHVSIVALQTNYTAANLPLYGIHLLPTATDNIVSDVVVNNAATAGVRDEGSGNTFNIIHPYGYPLLTYYASYSMQLLGTNAQVSHLYSDGSLLAGVEFGGCGNSVTNSIFFWPAGGQVSTAFAATIDTGLTGCALTLKDNTYVGFTGSGQTVNLTDTYPGLQWDITGNVGSSSQYQVQFLPQGQYVMGGVNQAGDWTIKGSNANGKILVISPQTTQNVDEVQILAPDGTMALGINNLGVPYSDKTPTFSILGNAATAANLVGSIGGEVISKAPHMAWSNYNNYGVTNGAYIRMSAPFYVEQAITITRFTYALTTSGATCSTVPVVGVWDGNSYITTLALSNATGSFDSGALSINVAAGKTLTLGLQTAAVGCGTVPAGQSFVVNYKMQ